MKNAKCKVQKLKRSLSKDKRAVSPVIGVILMVAITVILAAVIAAFVFGIGTTPTAPQASIYIKQASVANGLFLEHRGGNGVVLADMRIIIDPDVSSAATGDEGVVSGGTDPAPFTATPSPECGSASIWESGETGEVDVTTTGVALVAGQTLEVTVLHIPSGQQVFKGRATTTT